MKTLVIHPTDYTTDFLSAIYAGEKDWTIITENPTNSGLKKAIKEHDRIIMLGHGDAQGLFGHKRRLITSQHVYLLRDKEVIAIWCHADAFVKKYDLKGFHTGMFISEMDEAYYEGVYGVSNEEIEKSNEVFATAVGTFCDEANMLYKVREVYENNDSAVVVYNHSRLGYNLPVVEEVDLFERYDTLPENVQVILEKYSNDENTYEACGLLVAELEAVGYTCEYGLDAVPHDLRKL